MEMTLLVFFFFFPSPNIGDILQLGLPLLFPPPLTFHRALSSNISKIPFPNWAH